MIPSEKRILCVKTLLAAFVIAGMFACSSHASMYQFQNRLSMIFPNGKVMLYSGMNKGLREGDIYGLFANGVRFGVVQIYDTDRFSSIAVVLHADKILTEDRLYTFRLYDGPLEAGLVEYPPTMPIEGAPAPAPEKKTEKKKKKKPEKEAQTSSRRKKASDSKEKEKEESVAPAEDSNEEKKSSAGQKRTSRKSSTKTRRMAVTQ